MVGISGGVCGDFDTSGDGATRKVPNSCSKIGDSRCLGRQHWRSATINAPEKARMKAEIARKTTIMVHRPVLLLEMISADEDVVSLKALPEVALMLVLVRAGEVEFSRSGMGGGEACSVSIDGGGGATRSGLESTLTPSITDKASVAASAKA